MTDAIAGRSEAIARATGARQVEVDSILDVECDLFSPNAGGLLSVLFETGELDESGIVARVERIGADLDALLERSERQGLPPFRVAALVVAERLAAARSAKRT